eukprot:TRINITY_DN13531_c0_g1_i1.p3 TRINITY_DN13531_c0_g1~~TRINITY_DN13531_c0_g1_i1.p3  ORF type:complete len:107 (+),score=16.70 TRINITY_DN13531_c0_g1_i1:335-655(+)
MGNSAKSKKADSQLESNLQDSVQNQDEEYEVGGLSSQQGGDQVPEMRNKNKVNSHQLDVGNQRGSQGQLPRTISWKDFKGEELVSVREYQPSEDGDCRGEWCCTIM